MKTIIPLAIASIAIGFAAGWLIKSDSEKPENARSEEARSSSRVVTAPKASVETPAKSNQRNRRVVIHRGGSGSEMTPEAKKAFEEAKAHFKGMTKKRFNDKLDTKIADMVQELNLNAEQEKALRAFYDDHFGKLDMGDLGSLTSDPDIVKETAAILRGDELAEYMQDHLSSEQLEDLKSMQERQKTNEVESVALKDLANLQKKLDLSQEQKDAIYGLLMEDAEKVVAERSDVDRVVRAVMPNNVIGNMDVGGMLSDTGVKLSPEERKAARQKEVDEKVERMSSVLNEAQLTKYRQSLETRKPQFGGIISGGGAGGISITPSE